MKEVVTIAEAKEWLAECFDEGVTCPCCLQLVKRYKRKLNPRVAAAMGGLRRTAHTKYDGTRA